MTAEDLTLSYYARNAEEFATSAMGVDFSETQRRFAELLPPRARVLDFGCGSGRDARAFLEMGLRVTATDGSPEWPCLPLRGTSGRPHRPSGKACGCASGAVPP